MFAAMLLACWIGGPCLALDDRRGPYETEAACQERLAEMARDLTAVSIQAGHLPPVIRDARCVPVEIGEMT